MVADSEIELGARHGHQARFGIRHLLKRPPNVSLRFGGEGDEKGEELVRRYEDRT